MTDQLKLLSEEERKTLWSECQGEGFCGHPMMRRALLTIDELEKERDGFRENALALAVRLGIDPETMNDAQTWHTSAEAISTIQARQKKLVETLRNAMPFVWCDEEANTTEQTRYIRARDEANEALREIREGDANVL